MDYVRELAAALGAAARAADYLRAAYEAFTPIPDAPASISTEADRTSQDLILAELAASFPDGALCAEEGTPALQGGGWAGGRGGLWWGVRPGWWWQCCRRRSRASATT